jgi:hypothetical protein
MKPGIRSGAWDFEVKMEINGFLLASEPNRGERPLVLLRVAAGDSALNFTEDAAK